MKTIETVESIEAICDNLERAFKDQGDDPVSLVTIIDMYNDQVNSQFKKEQKEQYLNKLLNVLSENPEVVSEIGWDLPKGLLKFHTMKNLLPHRGLRNNAIVVAIMNNFQEIALHGNPKECLLIGCQLLSELSVADIEQEVEEYNQTNEAESWKRTLVAGKDYVEVENPVEFLLGLNTYVLFELIQTALRRIQSLYPSKFLGMAVSAICKFVRSNVDSIDNTIFVLRRIFTFCRNYSPNEMPSDAQNSSGVSKEELAKIAGDEAALQGKVLRSLCTFAIGYCMKNKHLRIDVRYYTSFAEVEYEEHPMMEEFVDICLRFYQLAYSFDIDLKEEFINLLEETKNIYKSLPPDSEIANGEASRAIGQVVYQLSYTYQLQKLTKAKGLDLDPLGMVVLSGLHYLETKQHLVANIKIQDAIYLFIRCSTPALFSPLFSSEVAEEISRYWLWVSITNSSYKDLKAQLSELPSYINSVFLQMLLLTTCNQSNEQTRMITFTLLTRILCLMPEETTFTFTLDTLLTCPYVKPKICILGILKDLMLRTCERKQDISTQLENLQIDSDKSSSQAVTEPPALPPRVFVSINDDRMASIHSVALIAIANASGEISKKEKANKENLILLQNYLNFFAALRKKWDKDLLKGIHDEVATNFNVKTSETTPEIGFIKIANETLGKYL